MCINTVYESSCLYMHMHVLLHSMENDEDSIHFLMILNVHLVIVHTTKH